MAREQQSDLSGKAGAPARGRELRARGRETLLRLLDAGVTAFGRHGYHATRVEDIVQAAETSHGTFYLYFANKEELFRAVTADVAEALHTLARSLPEIDRDANGFRALRQWVEGFSALYDQYGPVIRAWTEAEVDGSDFDRLSSDVLQGFAATVADRFGATDGLDAEIAALALTAMLERFHYYAIAGQLGADHDRVEDGLTRVVWSTLFAEPAPVRARRGPRRSHSSAATST